MNPNSYSSGYTSGSGVSSSEVVTLQEMIAGTQLATGTVGNMPAAAGTNSPFTQIGENAQANFLPMIFGLAGIKITQKLVRKMGTARSFNRLSDAIGTGDLIRA